MTKQLEFDFEEWRDVKGYEGLYKVSSHGRVVSYRGNQPKYLAQSSIGATREYLAVCLTSPNKPTKSKLVHRLVALNFISNPENKACVNHIDNNPRNNRVDNLEWATHQENADHRKVTHTNVNRRSKPRGYAESQIEWIKSRLEKKWSVLQIANTLEVVPITVYAILAKHGIKAAGKRGRKPKDGKRNAKLPSNQRAVGLGRVL
jgi:hypothetical protein